MFSLRADSVVVRNINGIDQGSTALFECLQKDGRETPAKVLKWLRKGDELPLVHRGRIFVTPSNTKHKLYVMEALPSDSGSYTCVADVDGKAVNASGRLRVYCEYIKIMYFNITVIILMYFFTFLIIWELYFT